MFNDNIHIYCTKNLKNKNKNNTEIKFYKTMGTPVLCCKSELCIPTKDIEENTECWDKIKKKKGYKRIDHIRNEYLI